MGLPKEQWSALKRLKPSGGRFNASPVKYERADIDGKFSPCSREQYRGWLRTLRRAKPGKRGDRRLVSDARRAMNPAEVREQRAKRLSDLGAL